MRLVWSYFIFDGKISLDYGVKISDSGSTWDGAERDVKTQSVPGRSGDLIYDNGRYKNCAIKYACYMVDGFPDNFEAFRDWLLAHQTAYYRLEDTYRPEEYRMARVRGDLDAKLYGFPDSVEFNVSFDCKPQRYLKSGERTYTFTAAGEIRNPTNQTALPLIITAGSGSLQVGGRTVSIASNSYDSISIDCERMECYSGSNNCNNLITASDGFPVLPPGDTGITWSGFSSVSITPRWFKI